jgi:hypothetical protein
MKIGTSYDFWELVYKALSFSTLFHIFIELSLLSFQSAFIYFQKRLYLFSLSVGQCYLFSLFKNIIQLLL